MLALTRNAFCIFCRYGVCLICCGIFNFEYKLFAVNCQVTYSYSVVSLLRYNSSVTLCGIDCKAYLAVIAADFKLVDAV